MIIFYSGEENRSLPEFVIPKATVMLTYVFHGKGGSSARFRRMSKARRQQKRAKK